MWSADLKNTGQRLFAWGQFAQNQAGKGPGGAVETRYPRARGCWESDASSPPSVDSEWSVVEG